MRPIESKLLLLAALLLVISFPLPGQVREEFDPVLGLRRVSEEANPTSGVVDVGYETWLNVRSGPGVEHAIVGRLFAGDKLAILETTENGWHKIDFRGSVAYVCGYWVHKGKDPWHNAGLAGPGRSEGNDEPPQRPTGQTPAASGGLLTVPLIDQRTGGGQHPDSYCGPTSVRMVLAHFGIRAGADEVALGRFGGPALYQNGVGATHAGMARALKHYGLNARLEYSKSLESLRKCLDQGHPVIIGVKGNIGPYSTSGHIMVVVGMAPGGVIVNDPWGGVRRTIPHQTFLNCWSGLKLEGWK